MKSMPTEMPAEPKTEERLPWHKPEVQCLSVSLDTGGFGLGAGSAPDAVSGE